MTDREKLIELLEQVQDEGAIVIPTGQSDRIELVKNKKVADHLISEGVTVRERGRWADAHEIKSFRHTNIPVVQCSKCECYFCDIINNHHYMYHFCPNCGADMRGEEDG